MNKNKTYQELLIAEDTALEIMNTATNAAHKEAMAQGAPLTPSGELEFDGNGGLVGFPEYGRILRDELIKHIPEELLILVRKMKPEEHLERWNHPFTVMHIFWMGYCNVAVDEQTIQAAERSASNDNMLDDNRVKLAGEA